MKAFVKYALIGGAVALVVLTFWPYRFIASPNSKIRLVDDSGQPLGNVRIVRKWHTSEEQRGQEEAVTDSNGAVRFQQRSAQICMLKRITKPLLVFVPAACGPDGEIYGYSEFRIDWPSGYTLKFDGDKWKREGEVWKNQEGICIRDPDVIRQFGHESYAELYFFNKSQDFDYTLTVYREQK